MTPILALLDLAHTVLRYNTSTSMDLCLALGEGQHVSWNLDLGGDP